MPIKNVRVVMNAYNATPASVTWVQLDPSINCEANVCFATGGGFTRVVTNCTDNAAAQAADTAGLFAGIPAGAGGTNMRLNPSKTWLNPEAGAGGYAVYANISY